MSLRLASCLFLLLPGATQAAPADQKLSWKLETFEKQLPGCDTKPVTRCAHVSLSYPTVTGGKAAGTQEITAAIQDMLLTPLEKGKAPASPEEFAAQILAHYQTWLQRGGDPKVSWKVERKIDVDFSSPVVFCVRLAERVEQGGTRPAKNTVYFNFRPEDGTLIQLSELIRSDRMEEFRNVARKHFNNKDQKVHAGEDQKLPGEEFSLPKNYAIEKDGLRFRYEEDQVEIHAIRTPEFVVPYSDIRSFLKPGIVLPG